MKHKFPDKRLKLSELQAAMQAYAPPEGFARKPEFMDRKPRKQETKKREHPENDLQLVCCDYLRTQPRILFFSVPNHLYSKGDPAKVAWYIAQQKRMGLLPGVSDIVMVFRNKHGASTIAFAELKVGHNQLSEAQANFQERANERGCFTGTVRSLEDLQNLLEIAQY